MRKLSPFFVLLTIVLVNFSFTQFAIAQKNPAFSKPENAGANSYKNILPLLPAGRILLSALPQKENRFSAYGDFLVSVVEIVDPATGKIIGSRTDRIVVINGVTYKAIVSARREQMTSKLNIPLQGVVAGDTVVLDDSPARIVSSAEYTFLGVDQSKLSSEAVVAQIGGQIAYFSSAIELDKFVRDEVIWESKIGPTRAGLSPAADPTSAYTEGVKSVLFMRLDFPDKPGEPVSSGNVPLTQASAQSLMDSAVSPFYVSNSYSKTSLNTTVTTVLRMPKNLSDYVDSVNQSGGTGLNLILTDARAAAQAAGYNVNSFDRDIVATAYNSSLNFAGLGFVGAKGNWLNGYFDLRTAAHEMGHNYGLRHANLYYPTSDNPIGSGTDIEYGDCYDNMGNGYSGNCFSNSPNIHFNARYKRLLDWITAANVQTVTTDGTYRITAMDTSSPSGISLLRVANYWLEFRQLIPGNAANGVLIRRDYGTNQTELLDMTPITTRTGDEPLLSGQSFFDGTNGIRITTIGKGGTSPESVDVKVEFNVFTNPPKPPTNVTATVVSSSQVNLSWSPSTNPSATSYNIRITDAPFKYTGVTTTSQQIKNLAQNTTYTFEVQAVNSYGTSDWSSPITAKTLASVPSTPTNVTATPVSTSQINVFWNQNATNENVTSYNLRVNGSSVTTGITYLSYAVKNLNRSTSYSFEIQAVNSLGVSAWSSPVSAATYATNPAPNAPTNVSPQAVSTSQINVFWNASTSQNIVGYNLRVNGSSIISGITYLSYAVKNLNPNTAYTFEVQAVDSTGAVSAWSAPVSATTNPVIVPNAPTNVSLQTVSTSQINVFWNASTSQNIVGYNLRINGSTVIPNITYLSYAVKNLNPNTTYTFEVQAIDSAGAVSAWSTPVSATTNPVAVINPPTNVSPQTVSSSQINVFWGASTSPNIASYNLRVNGTSVISGITYLSYAVKNLNPNTTYTFEVQAVDSSGAVSAWSAPVSATTNPVAVINPPTNVSPQVVSPNQINVFWNASTSQNITSYNLRVNGSTVIPNITYLSYAVKNLNPNTTYTFEVQAVDSSGAVSAWSTPVSATTNPVAVPNAPTNVSPQAVSSSQINVFWNASTSPNITSYNLRVNGASVISGITYLSYAVKNLNPNTTYSFEVQAVDSTGSVSAWSAPVSATTNAVVVPNAPTNVAPQVVSATQINVFWNASTSQNIVGYNLRINGSTVIPNITYLSYAVKNLNPNTTYTFEVQAIDSAGAVSAWSVPVSATTTPSGTASVSGEMPGGFNGYDLTALGSWQYKYGMNTNSLTSSNLNFDWRDFSIGR